MAAVAQLNSKIPTATTAEQMKVYFPHRLTKRLTERNKDQYIYSLNPKQNKVSYDDFSGSPEKYVMLVRPTILTYLHRIKAARIRLIKSIWGGYWDEPNTERFRSWVEEHCEQVKDIHSSGHADTQSLQRIVEFVRPKTIVPIHTDAPKRFCDIFVNDDVKCLDNNEVLYL